MPAAERGKGAAVAAVVEQQQQLETAAETPLPPLSANKKETQEEAKPVEKEAEEAEAEAEEEAEEEACLLRLFDLPLHSVDRRLRLVLYAGPLLYDLARGHLVDVLRAASCRRALGLGPLQVAVQLLQRCVVGLGLRVIRGGRLSG